MFVYANEWPNGDRVALGTAPSLRTAKARALARSFRPPQRCVILDETTGRVLYIFEGGKRKRASKALLSSLWPERAA